MPENHLPIAVAVGGHLGRQRGLAAAGQPPDMRQALGLEPPGVVGLLLAPADEFRCAWQPLAGQRHWRLDYPLDHSWKHSGDSVEPLALSAAVGAGAERQIVLDFSTALAGLVFASADQVGPPAAVDR